MASMDVAPDNLPPPRKRLIICCDGTWMNSDRGYEKPTAEDPRGKLQAPSNVTRISRAFKRQCSDGRVQIIYYHTGLGTGSTLGEMITGGALGTGISEHMREVYAFICANYVDGDEIILTGFSRGAFTVRSVAGMICDLGLLTRQGMEYFYPIFKDMQNWQTPDYGDPFPEWPFPNKPRGIGAPEVYREMLLQRGFTRVYEKNNTGNPIKVRAIGVWDTVGSLGIPSVSWLSKIGFPRGTKEFRFYDTNLSDKIEHAFQALALDEHRPPFGPSLWERGPGNRLSTDLRQVWFPGNHGNVGGGWDDQGIANMSLAWMMDQLASVGVEFDDGVIERIFKSTANFYAKLSDKIPSHGPAGCCACCCACCCSALSRAGLPHFAVEPLCENNSPLRPWGLGKIQSSSDCIHKLAGQHTRMPGRYHRVDSWTGRETREFLQNTNERIHSSVRIRLAVAGMALDDDGLWKCPALQTKKKGGCWRPRQTDQRFEDPIPRNSRRWGPPAPLPKAEAGEGQEKQEAEPATPRTPSPGIEYGKTRWVWDYFGPERYAPPGRTLVEEPLGPYERLLLKLSGGQPNVWEFASRRTLPEAISG